MAPTLKRKNTRSTNRGGWATKTVNGYRSGLEERIAQELLERGVDFEYEQLKLDYLRPAKKSKYTPDFVIIKEDGSPMVIETKGRFLTADRQKMLLIKAQYPDMDIRFIFSNAKQKISKQSNTTYAMWSEKNGFKYSHSILPEDWLKE